MSLFGRPPRDGNCCRQLCNPLGVVHSHTQQQQQQQLRKRANNTFLVLAKRCALSFNLYAQPSADRIFFSRVPVKLD